MVLLAAAIVIAIGGKPVYGPVMIFLVVWFLITMFYVDRRDNK